MQLSTFNPTQISNAVWTAAARTLTADPATDAGAATLVWNRTTVAPAAGSFGALVNLNLDSKVSAAGSGTIVDPSSDNSFTFASGTGGVFSAYTVLIAATGGLGKSFVFQVSEQNALNDVCNFALAIGGVGAEVDFMTFRFDAGTLGDGINLVVPFAIPAGSRVTCRAKVAGGTASTVYGSFYVIR